MGLRMRWAFLLLVTACGASRASSSFEGGVYRDGVIAFQVPPPPASWKRVDMSNASLAYRDDEHGASVLLNARCSKPDQDTPLVALTNQILIGSTEREFSSQELEPFDHREALHSKLRAKWDGVPKHLDLFVAKKDGCIYDFVWIGEKEGTTDFETFVRGFRTLQGSGTAGGSEP